MSSAYASLRVVVRDVKMSTCKLRTPHLRIKFGHRVFTAPKRPAGAPWGDTFDFDISLHQHLFWTIQIDVYDARMLRRHAHIGRSEIRLYKLAEAGLAGETWHDLKEKQHCYANLTDLGMHDASLEGYKVGALLLDLCYTIKDAAVDGKEQAEDGGGDECQALAKAQTVSRTRSASAPDLFSFTEDNVAGTSSSSSSASASTTISSDGDPEVCTGSLDERASQSIEQFFAASASVSVSSEPSDTDAGGGSSREVNTLLKRISGWLLAEDDSQVVQNVLNELASFGQGIEVGGMSLTVAFFLLQRFYRTMDIPYSNNIVIGKKDLDLIRSVFRYAYAALGWPALYFFGKRNEIFSDAVSSRANYRAVIEYLSMDPDDMLICDLDEHLLFRPNFFVALDRRLSAVVLSIRGTMSLRDTLTNLSCEYVPWDGGLAHSGMLTAAGWFLENIGRQLVAFAQEYGMNNIYVTGHSLGGGTAALTTIMMAGEFERSGSWPRRADGSLLYLHCYSFGTPAVVSADLAAKYRHLVDSFICGEDVVPRMSYGSMADLQILMVYAAEIGRASDVFQKMPDSELHRRLETCRQAILEQKNVVNTKLRIPGAVHHIMRLKAPNQRRYTVIDTCGPERFVEMSLRKKMLQDHLPNRYERGLEEAYVTYLLHELEERQNAATHLPASIQEKILSVVSLINRDPPPAGLDPDAGNGASTGSLFPRPTSSTQSPGKS